MATIEAFRLLAFSGGFAIFMSCILGFAMLVPLQPWGRGIVRGVNFKQIGAAHLDWIMLGLMQGLAAAVIWVFFLEPSRLVVWAMICGSWINPLSYIFRAFGVDAFSFAGGSLQRMAAAVGGVSSIALLCAWGNILYSAWWGWI